MNKIFKTVWSAVRGCMVTVSELGRRSVGGSVKEGEKKTSFEGGKRSTERKFVPSALVMALAGVFVFGGCVGWAAWTFPRDCASVGGTMKNGVCYIGDGTQTETVVKQVNDEWTLTEGDMTISGGSGYRVFGIKYNAYLSGTGTISNTGTGTLTITGGSGPDTYGIDTNDHDGGTGTILNTGPGSLTITGGSSGS